MHLKGEMDENLMRNLTCYFVFLVTLNSRCFCAPKSQIDRHDILNMGQIKNKVKIIER